MWQKPWRILFHWSVYFKSCFISLKTINGLYALIPPYLITSVLKFVYLKNELQEIYPGFYSWFLILFDDGQLWNLLFKAFLSNSQKWKIDLCFLKKFVFSFTELLTGNSNLFFASRSLGWIFCRQRTKGTHH